MSIIHIIVEHVLLLIAFQFVTVSSLFVYLYLQGERFFDRIAYFIPISFLGSLGIIIIGLFRIWSITSA